MEVSVLNMSTSRKRRNPYTQIACQECKRRKVKCSGGNPCAACQTNRTSCFYERSTRFRAAPSASSAASRRKSKSDSAANAALPSPVLDSASGTAQDAQLDATESSTTSTARDESSAHHARPGSSDYYFGLARRLLVDSSAQHGDNAGTEGQGQKPNTQDLRKILSQRLASTGRQPPRLTLVPTCRWLEILDQYEEEIGLLYPFLDITDLRSQLRDVAGPESGPSPGAQETRVNQELEEVLILILAVMAVLEDPAISDSVDGLTEEIVASTWRRTHTGNTSSHDVNLLILVSIYYFMTDRESLSWRNIGSVVRILQELGYHHSANIQQQFSSQHEIDRAKRAFWSAYLLDRRWSFGTGLPFAIQDSDIDIDADFTDNSLSSTYLKSMVSYCRIAAEVRGSSLGVPSSSPAKDAARDLLDFRIGEWRRNLPRCLQFDADRDFNPLEHPRGQYRLRLLLYLRANQMKIIIHRKSALRHGNTTVDTSSVNSLVGVARDTILVLAKLAGSSDIYQSQQKTFNHFLESALSALLLVTCCANTADEQACIEEVHMALDLVQKLSSTSSITRKLGEKLMCFANIGGHAERCTINHARGRPIRRSAKKTGHEFTAARRPRNTQAVTDGHAGQVVTPTEYSQDCAEQTTAVPADDARRYMSISETMHQSIQSDANNHSHTGAPEMEPTEHNMEQPALSLLSSLESSASTVSPAGVSTTAQFQPEELLGLPVAERLDEFFLDLGDFWMDYDRLFAF